MSINKLYGGRALRIVIGLMLLFLMQVDGAGAETWSVVQNGSIVEIAYGSGTNFPQYAALHLNSSYFRMVAPDTTWGTSVILLPSFWENGKYYQNASVTYQRYVEGSNLILLLSGNISNLTVNAKVSIFPPYGNIISANVEVNVTGTSNLDNRPSESFKPVTLSSMHVSSNLWDARSAYADSMEFSLPQERWIILPPINSSIFGLKGGSSDWKINAPTVEILLNKSYEITGWVTNSSNPNDDNVGLWASSSHLVRTWNYTIVVKKETVARTITVDDSGGADYTRIQDAIDNASAGDTILVYSGTYYENVNVTKHLILHGIDNGGGKPVVDSEMKGSAIVIKASGVTLDGFNPRNSTLGIYVNSNNNTIVNNNASNGAEINLKNSNNNILSGNLANYNSFGIYLENSDNNTISSNTANRNSVSGIHLIYSNNNTLNGNSFSINKEYGIYMGSSNNNTLIGNYAYSSYGTKLIQGTTGAWQYNIGKGIHLHSSSKNTLKDNNVNFNNLYGISFEKSDNNTLIGNNASSNEDTGIFLWDSDNNRMSGNNLTGSSLLGDTGIDLSDSYNITLSYNNVSNFETGIILRSSSNNLLIGNKAKTNDKGIVLSFSNNSRLMENNASNNSDGIVLTFSSNNMLSGNNVSNNNRGIVQQSSSNNMLSGNIVNSNNYYGIYLGYCHLCLYSALYSTYYSNYTPSNNNTLNGNIVSNNNYGIYLESFNQNYSSNNNRIYHNSILSNINQSYDNSSFNSWDSSYPTGGNYWSDYTGVDLKSGPNQNQPGSDGIGDNPYNIDGGAGSQDRYPFLKENGWISDITPPVINSVILSDSTPDTGEAILVTVNATDNVEVTGVEADGVSLTKQSDDIWNGTITAIEGTHSVNVSARDAAGNVAWNNSTSYNATTPPSPDTTSPVINSVTLSDSTPDTGDAVLVTVNATDNVEVTGVMANGVSLTKESNDIWNGTIIALEGTHLVNVSARDAAGHVTWDNSSSYTPTTPLVLNSISVSLSTAILNIGGTQQLIATAKDQSGNPMAGINISWTISNLTVGSVIPSYAITGADGNASTTFTAHATGTANVNATNGSVTGSAIVTVTPIPPITGAISGYVINDANNNRKWDDGEKGIEGWEISLKGIEVENANIKMETVTIERGFYQFDNVPPGKYMIVEKHKSGYFLNSAPIIVLDHGEHSPNNNFMFKPTISLHNEMAKFGIQ